MNANSKEKCVIKIMEATTKEEGYRSPLLTLRLVILAIIVALLTIHMRSLRVFRWEISVSGGLLIAYCVAVIALALSAGAPRCGGHVFQAYVCAIGAALLAINAAVIWQRWRSAGEITKVVAELLMAMGMPLKRQVIIKVTLSAMAASLLLVDLIITYVFTLW